MHFGIFNDEKADDSARQALQVKTDKRGNGNGDMGTFDRLQMVK